MKCGYSREILALYVENDLPSLEGVEKVNGHVLTCTHCQVYCEQLRHIQSVIRSGFKPSANQIPSQETLFGLRRNVMSQISTAARHFGWMIRLERLFFQGFRRQRYAVAGFALVVIVSVSLLGQIYQRSEPKWIGPGPVFVGRDTLVRPVAYRDWVFVGSSIGRNVYINPPAFREYAATGKFPEGTVMVLELAEGEMQQASVKDSRFDGGWGYFSFTDNQGKPKQSATPEDTGCRSCHEARAERDHVFTQFYPVLKL